ncbi:MAG: dTMP kinase [Christensenellales bacterium]
MINLKKHTYPGKLIVFEGTDGAGKTTMINMTYEYLTDVFGSGRIMLTKQPTDMSRKTKLFQKMMYCKNHDEIDYRAVQLLTLSDRVQHGYEDIEPALKAGKAVICDRYIYTSIVNMWARGYKNEDWFFDAAKNIIKPDITFLAYAPPELAIARIKARPEESRRHLNEPLLYKVASEFLELQRTEGFVLLNTADAGFHAFCDIKKELNRLYNS